MKQIIEKALENQKHEYYDRTCEVAEYWRSMVTGKHQEEYIVSYRERESEAQKEQRIHLYNPRTKDIAGRSIAVFDKVDNSDPAIETIMYEENTESNKQRINDIEKNVSDFKDGRTLKHWLSENYKNSNAIDPNAWIILTPYEEDGVTKTTADILPSHSVLDFSYNLGDLEYLVTYEEKTVLKKSTKGGTETLKCYYVYTKDIIYHYVELKDVVYEYPEGSDLMNIRDKKFSVMEYINIGGRVPAMRFGYYPDMETDNETFTSMLDSAEYLFKELVNRKSEFDITLALHTFLQKFQVAEPCDHVDEHKNACTNGMIGEHTCPSCEGTGLKIHTTAQDIILVKAPSEDESSENYINLQDRVYYPTLPFDIVNKQDELIDKYDKKVGEAIFGVDISERANKNVTATAISNFEDSINFVLSAYAFGKSAIYRFIVEQISLNKGFGMPVVRYEYADTFDILTLQELFIMLDSAKKSGASYSTIKSIQDDITAKQNIGNPLMIEAVRVRETFKPFKGLSSDERKMQLSALSQYDRNKIAYLYNDIIFDRLAAKEDLMEFIMYPYSRQLELVQQEVNIIVEQMKEDASVNTSQVLRSAVTRDTIVDDENDLLDG